MKNIALLIFLNILTAVRSEDSNMAAYESGYGEGENATSASQGFPPTIFYPVAVAALIVGVIVGSIVTAMIMVVTKKCSQYNSVQFSNTKEADFNESKRYLKSAAMIVSSDDEVSTTGSSSTINRTTTVNKPLPPIKPKDTEIPSNVSGNKKILRKANHTSDTNTTVGNLTAKKPIQPSPPHHMQRSISLGEPALFHTTTTTHTTPPRANEELLDSIESSSQEEEHYYSCDVSRETNTGRQKILATSGGSTSTASRGGLKDDQNYPPVKIKSATIDTVDKTNTTMSDGKKKGAVKSQNHEINDTPQYCNVGIKLMKDGQR